MKREVEKEDKESNRCHTVQREKVKSEVNVLWTRGKAVLQHGIKLAEKKTVCMINPVFWV